MNDSMNHHQSGNEARDEPETESARMARQQYGVLGDSTPVRLGFIIGLVVVLAGGFGGCIWWAATLSSKTDTIIAQLTMLNDKSNGHGAAISDLQAWRKLVDTVGTAAMMNKTSDLEKKMDDLARKLELHIVTTTKTP